MRSGFPARSFCRAWREYARVGIKPWPSCASAPDSVHRARQDLACVGRSMETLACSISPAHRRFRKLEGLAVARCRLCGHQIFPPALRVCPRSARRDRSGGSALDGRAVGWIGRRSRGEAPGQSACETRARGLESSRSRCGSGLLLGAGAPVCLPRLATNGLVPTSR